MRAHASSCSRTVRTLIILLLSAAGIGPVLAQANLEVLVLNRADNSPLPDIAVTLENSAIGYAETQKTNQQGKARFQALSTAGAYVVSIEPTEAFNEFRGPGLTLRTNFDRSVTISLAPRVSHTEQVKVEASRSTARINTVNAEVSSTLDQAELETLPIEGRDLTRALYRLPNVTQATGFYPEAPNVSINGANSLYTNYMVDGLDNNENFLGGQKFPVPIGFAQDVTVLTNNYSSEFGRTGNGIFNVTSRSGSNDFTGEVFYLTRPGPRIDSASSFPQRDLSGNDVKDGFERQQAGFGVGGPIVKDKTFYYVDVEGTRDYKDNLLTSPALGVADSVGGSNGFFYSSAKITHLWTPDFTTNFRVNLGHARIERQGGGLDGGVTFPSAGSRQDRESLLLAVNNKYVSSRLVSETNLQFSRFRWNYGQPLNGDGPQTVVKDPNDIIIAVLGHPGYVFDDLENTIQLQQKESFSFDKHLVKAGVDLVSSDFSLLGGGNEDGNYTVRLDQMQLDAVKALNKGADLDIDDIPSGATVTDYNVELQTRSFGKRQNILSLYAEDLWSPTSRLHITFGLRYDLDNLSKGGASKLDTNNVAPRLSLNYQIDDRSSVRGGFGIFYDKILYAVYSDALQQNSTSAGFRSQLQQLVDLGILPRDTDMGRVTFDGNISADFSSGITYLQGPSSASLQSQREVVQSNERRILNPDGYDNPYTEQFSIGYQRQMGANTLFYVDLVRTQSYNLFRLRDLNAPSPYPIDPDNVVVRSPAQADATRPVALVPGGARSIVVSETAGESRYNAANFTLIGSRGKLPLGYRVSYTLSGLRNNTEDINFKAQDANDFDEEWGPSINDRRHVISGVLNYYPWEGATFCLAALIQSGQPVNRIPDATALDPNGVQLGTTDLNGDGRSFGESYVGNSDRSPGESRNSDRLPWSRVFDLGASYKFPASRHQLEIRADIFNVFNTVNLSGYSNNATQSNQIQIGPRWYGIDKKNAGPPRQFQFGLRYTF